MLQSVGSQRVRHDRVTKLQQQNGVTILLILSWQLSLKKETGVNKEHGFLNRWIRWEGTS